MRLLCLIDNLGPGGAQRQLVSLAVGLKQRGHDVGFLVYQPQAHFRPLLEEAHIKPCQIVSSSSRFAKLLAVRRVLRGGGFDVVLAFLDGPVFYAELAGLPSRRWGLVAGERLAAPDTARGASRGLRHFHRLADAVITNSHCNRLLLAEICPALVPKLATVYNTTNLAAFRPCAPREAASNGTRALRLVVAASFHQKKNMVGVAKALALLRQQKSTDQWVVDWYGDSSPDSKPLEEAKRLVADKRLNDCLRFHSAIKDIQKEYQSADAVGLFSFYEGVPNAVCEGMACGKPILLSDVCDAGSLVTEGVNGFLCDPSSPESIAEVLRRFAELSQEQKAAMGAASRHKAEALFAQEPVLDRYERILFAATLRRGPPEDIDWPRAVPSSASRTLDAWKMNARMQAGRAAPIPREGR